jgi:cobalt-zinc-cadmium efflux system membrane fusion protein
VRSVSVKTGQFVQPQTEMFDIVNITHIHADFMVFEKDIHKVKVGQRVRFTIESMPDFEMEAVIYAVGKSFEADPKALHLHAEIEQKEGLLLPGMYVRGQILMGDSSGYALPDAAIVRNGDRHYIFKGHSHKHGDETEWAFKPIEVIVKSKDKGWTSFEPTTTIRSTDRFAWNKAYYLQAEMTKGDESGEHRH